MSSVSNTAENSQAEPRPSREQCLREAAGVYASWRAESNAQAVAA
ncbi:hypothetical protein QMQ05_05640 [Glutamicibacter ectropisis]|uniref:Uncharacterized protein n=1 Tax=Glutamicibacter ectropisis TaxID=3046593 RepID=A0AAU6WGV5_9MICC